MLAKLIEHRAHKDGISTLRDPAKWLIDWVGGRQSAAGVTVTATTATQLTAVYAAVNFLSKAVASLPLFIYRRLEDGGKERDPNHPLFRLFHDQPNRWQTSFEFREMLQGHVALRGNAYAQILFDAGGRVTDLIPRHPDRVRPFWGPDGLPVYDWQPASGGAQIILAGEMLHVRTRSDDGLVGIAPIDAAREALGSAIATQEYSARLFSNDARPGGVLKHPGKLSDEAHKKLKDSWETAHAGVQQAHRVAVLEEGLSWEQIGLRADQAQLLESRKFGVVEIARIFDLPPHILKDLDRASFSNIEQQSIELVVHSLRPWLVRWEQRLMFSLFSARDTQTHFVEFLIDALLRGDAAARSNFYRTLWGIGALSQNDVRRLENMNPIEGGDTFYVPLNMIPIGESPTNDAEGRTIIPEVRQIASLSEREKRQAKLVRGRTRLRNIHARLFKDAAGRMIRREIKAVREAVQRFLSTRTVEGLEAWLDDFYRRHQDAVSQTMRPTLATYAEATVAQVAEELGQDDVLSSDALERHVSAYAQRLGERHTGSSRGQLRELMAADNPLGAIERRLDEWQETRSEKITSREVVQAGNAFAVFAMTAAGVQVLRWMALGESCPLCTMMDGRTVGIKTPFLSPGDSVDPGEGTSPLRVDSAIGHPPLHEGCVPGDTHVLAQGITASSERWYDGDLIVIYTASGKRLASTPNHPILTSSGWLAAGLLQVGDNVLSCPFGDRHAAIIRDDQDMPATIQQIADAFWGSGEMRTIPMPGSAEDFHGDGRNGEITIVRTDSELLSKRDMVLSQHGSKAILSFRNAAAGALASTRVSGQPVFADSPPARSRMSGGHLADPFVRGHTHPIEMPSLRRAAWHETMFDQATPQDDSGNIQFLREDVFGLSCRIFADEVLDIEINPFHGLVFNLQTTQGFYFAEGIITHNCDCLIVSG